MSNKLILLLYLLFALNYMFIYIIKGGLKQNERIPTGIHLICLFVASILWPIGLIYDLIKILKRR